MATQGSLSILLTVVIGVSLIGFLRGTSEEHGLSAFTPDEAATSVEGVRTAPTYAGHRLARADAGDRWEADLATLAAATPGVLDPVSFEGASKADDLAARASRRAFDGAPPTIPHAIVQDGAAECLACHEDGLRLRGLLAPPVSHATYASCTQCHVVMDGPAPGGEGLGADPRDVDNRFAGLASPTSGTRYWGGAPPVIPHTTVMRERCESCHGVNGRDAIRSSHPWRQSCEQCHAGSAEAALRPGVP